MIRTNPAPTHRPSRQGLPQGTWIGEGTIAGSISDGALAARYDGALEFTLAVDEHRRVSGSGTWLVSIGSRTAVTGPRLQAAASLRLAGTPESVTFEGLQRVVGEVGGADTRLPIRLRLPLRGQLELRSVDTRHAAGSSEIEPGVTLSWSARRTAHHQTNTSKGDQ